MQTKYLTHHHALPASPIGVPETVAQQALTGWKLWDRQSAVTPAVGLLDMKSAISTGDGLGIREEARSGVGFGTYPAGISDISPSGPCVYALGVSPAGSVTQARTGFQTSCHDAATTGFRNTLQRGLK